MSRSLRTALVVACAAVATLTACSNALSTRGAATASALVEQGRALFRNKGCVTCHANERVPGVTGLTGIGPNLTEYQNDPEFLRRWLADPGAVRPGTRMPKLELTATEIEALIAFLSEPD